MGTTVCDHLVPIDQHCEECEAIGKQEWAKMDRAIRDDERKRVLSALIEFLEDGGGTFRKFISILGMDYTAAYDEGWMGFTNALADHESRILGEPIDPL